VRPGFFCWVEIPPPPCNYGDSESSLYSVADALRVTCGMPVIIVWAVVMVGLTRGIHRNFGRFFALTVEGKWGSCNHRFIGVLSVLWCCRLYLKLTELAVMWMLLKLCFQNQMGNMTMLAISITVSGL
jgi:hypothetical protein